MQSSTCLRFGAIRAGEQGHGLEEGDGRAGLAEAAGDLKVAPGVGGGEDRCAGAEDVPDLADEELFGLLRLGDVVDAGAAAAPVAASLLSYVILSAHGSWFSSDSSGMQ